MKNKVNENKVLYCQAKRYQTIKNKTKPNKCFLLCQTYRPTIILNYISKKVAQHTGGKWLIYGTKRRKDNQLQSLELPCRIS